MPGAWLLNTVDLAWRFGGKTRGHQGKRLQAWRAGEKLAKGERSDDLAEAGVYTSG